MTPEQTRTIRENMAAALPHLKAALEVYPKCREDNPHYASRVRLMVIVEYADQCAKALARQAAIENVSTAMKVVDRIVKEPKP